jgi:hypothetical protein
MTILRLLQMLKISSYSLGTGPADVVRRGAAGKVS